MDVAEFMGMEPTGDGSTWRLPVTSAVSTPGRFLFGGCGLAGGIVAMEAVTGRPAVWATAQYLSFAPTGSTVYWSVEVGASGKHITQARAVGRVDGNDILTVTGALGAPRDDGMGRHVWVSAPEVPAPDACPPRPTNDMLEDSVFGRVDQRSARGRDMADFDGSPSDGRASIWFRIPGHLEPSAATLAILGDYVTGGVSQSLGRHVMSRSLDNTLRIVQLVATDWLLCDIEIHAVADGFAHGHAHLFAQDGTYLGTASQSMTPKAFSAADMEMMRARAS